MKFTTPKLELELLETIDVVASSPEDTTNPDTPEQTTGNNDPYENDKW